MESLVNSKFDKFENSIFGNSKMILGGFAPDPNETGGGEKCLKDGSCMNYTSDYKREDGGMNYGGVTYPKREC
jgi:hypothetical protein